MTDTIPTSIQASLRRPLLVKEIRSFLQTKQRSPETGATFDSKTTMGGSEEMDTTTEHTETCIAEEADLSEFAGSDDVDRSGKRTIKTHHEPDLLEKLESLFEADTKVQVNSELHRIIGDLKA